MKITHAASLTNPQLTAELGRLAHAERQATVALIVHLAEFDARRLHLGAGFPSLYDYCMRVLHFTEDIACNRIAAARIARRHPVVLEMLGDGRLSPTTARLLKRYLTRANHEELRAAACWKSKRQVEELLAQRYPQADVPASIRVLPAPLPAPAPASSVPADAQTPGLARKRFAATTRPRKSRGQSEDSDHIPAEVRRAVFVCDLGRCRFVSPDGHRCETRRFTQFHHVHPRGAGGKATVENIELRCGPHNRHEAELFYGPGKHRGGVDVVSEPAVVYGMSPVRLPVPGRVAIGAEGGRGAPLDKTACPVFEHPQLEREKR